MEIMDDQKYLKCVAGTTFRLVDSIYLVVRWDNFSDELNIHQNICQDHVSDSFTPNWKIYICIKIPLQQLQSLITAATNARR